MSGFLIAPTHSSIRFIFCTAISIFPSSKSEALHFNIDSAKEKGSHYLVLIGVTNSQFEVRSPVFKVLAVQNLRLLLCLPRQGAIEISRSEPAVRRCAV